MAIEKIEILGAVLSYQLNCTANLTHSAYICGKWAGLAAVFWLLRNGLQDFDCSFEFFGHDNLFLDSDSVY